MQSFDEIDPETIDSVINRMEDRIDTWCQKSCSERMASLHRIADQVRFRSDELSKLITLEVDKLLLQGYQEVALIY